MYTKNTIRVFNVYQKPNSCFWYRVDGGKKRMWGKKRISFFSKTKPRYRIFSFSIERERPPRSFTCEKRRQNKFI